MFGLIHVTTDCVYESLVLVHREHWESFQRRSFSCSRWRSRVRGFWRRPQQRDRSTSCETWSACVSPGWRCTTWVSIFTGTWNSNECFCCLGCCSPMLHCVFLRFSCVKPTRDTWWGMNTLNFLSFSPRLLNSSTEQESNLWRVGGLSVDNTSITELSLNEGDSQARTGSSGSQRGQQQDKPAEVYGALASCGAGRGGGSVLAGETTGHDGWLQGHGEGHLMLAGHLSPSRTDRDSGSFKGDEVDSSDWSIRSRAGQKVSKDLTTEGSPHGDKQTGSDSSVLAGDRGATSSTSKFSYGEERRLSSREGHMEAGEGLSPGRGGAFRSVLFRRDQAKTSPTAPVEHTMVLLCSVHVSCLSGHLCRGSSGPLLFLWLYHLMDSVPTERRTGASSTGLCYSSPSWMQYYNLLYWWVL